MMDWLKNRLDALNIDFVGPRWVLASLSGVLVLASWFLFFVWPGPQWGIDFAGGAEVHVQFNVDREGNPIPNAAPVDIGAIRDVLAEMGLGDDVVQRVGPPDSGEYQIRIKDATGGSQDLQDEVLGRLREKYGADQIGPPRVDAEVGTRLTVPFTSGRAPAIAEVTATLLGVEGITISDTRDPGELAFRFPGVADLVVDELKAKLQAPFNVLATDAVGPKVGGDLRNQGFVAVLITLALILVYVGFRFDIAFAPGAVLALIHDVSLTAGIFVLMGLEFNLAIVGALLTIVGYSLNDTIVIYDRIRENMERYRRKDLPELINTSINETFSRTIATSLTTVIAITPFLLFGGPIAEFLLPEWPSAGDVIWSFSFAMLIGIFFGTYSTIYIASPAVIVMQQLRPALSRLIPDMTSLGAPVPEDADPALIASERRRKERDEKAQKPT